MKATEKIEALIKAGTERLNSALNRLPVPAQRRYLIMTGCIMAGLCLFMVIAPFTKKDTVTRIVPEGKISAAVVPAPDDPLLSPADLLMLRDFKQVMDSLKIHDLTTYHEILQGRRGLLDSVELLLRWSR